MLNEREVSPLSLERFYDIVAEGRRTEIDAALARFPASARLRDPIAIGLRAMKSVTTGDLPGGVAVLRRGVAHSSGRVRQYLLELLIPEAGRVVSTAAIAKHLAHGRGPLGATTVAVYVHRLRP